MTILSNVMMILALISLVGVAISAWFGSKAAKAEEDETGRLDFWLKILIVSSICLVLFAGGSMILEKLGVF